LWFRPGNQFTLVDFQTPAGFDSGAFEVTQSSARAVTMTREFEVTNHSGTRFTCAARRTIRLLDAESASLGLASPLPAGLRWVGFESVNALTNAGAAPWRQETGLLCIRILGMFNPLPCGQVIAPFVPGDDAQLGPKVHPYFGAIPPERLRVGEDHALFTCDGACRTKIGISPRRARNVVGSWDPDAGVLTVVAFNLPGAAHRLPYVNSQWEIQQNPYDGEVVNSYNDGRDPITGTVLGPFHELETSSAVADLAPGETIVRVHRTFHFTSSRHALDALFQKALGVDLDSAR